MPRKSLSILMAIILLSCLLLTVAVIIKNADSTETDMSYNPITETETPENEDENTLPADDNDKNTSDSPLEGEADDVVTGGSKDDVKDKDDVSGKNADSEKNTDKTPDVTKPDTDQNSGGDTDETADGENNPSQGENTDSSNQETDEIPEAATGDIINITKNKSYETIQEVIDDAESGNTIKLMDDILLDTDLSIDKDIILDLNSMTVMSNLNANEEENENAMAINISGTATVKNGTIVTNNGTGGIKADGANTELTLENITIDQNGLNSKKIHNSTAVMATNGAKITIESGNYSAETDGVLVKSNGGTVIIEGGTFTAGRSAARNEALGEATHSLTINGGTFNTKTAEYTGSDSYALYGGGENHETTVNGGIFNGEVSSENAYMIINGGTFNKTIFQGGGHQDYYELKGGKFIDNISDNLLGKTVIPEGYYSITKGQYYTVFKDIADTSWYADTSATSFIIGTAEELAGLAKLVNNGNNFSKKTIILSNDIDLKDIEWTPIGTGNNPFKGNFDGNNKKILNLNINRDTSYNGLFGSSLEGKLENVTLENVNILINTPDTVNYAYTGSLAGMAQYINNVTVTGSIHVEVTGAGRYIGGIVGYLYDGFIRNSAVINSRGAGFLSGKYDLGGLAGMVYYGTSITNSIVKNMEFNGYLGVGGISGRIQNENGNAQFLLDNIHIENARFTNFYDTIESYCVGGFLGYPYLEITVTIIDSKLKDVIIESSHLNNGLFYGLYQNTEDYGKVILENVTFSGNCTTESGEYNYLRNLSE